jgi:hypothetical protein
VEPELKELWAARQSLEELERRTKVIAQVSPGSSWCWCCAGTRSSRQPPNDKFTCRAGWQEREDPEAMMPARSGVTPCSASEGAWVCIRLSWP